VLSSLFGGSALADTTPLRERIATYVTPDLLAAIAAEHAKGRTLFVGTTNIDAGRSVIWNMGKIASEGTPQALALFRDVILASAAIPMAFPPVFFEVEADGTRYQEMHVDGGVTSQVTILSPQIPGYLLDEVAQVEVDRNLFVIVNGAVVPPPDVVEATMINIGRSSIERLWYAQAVGDLYKIHAVAERDDLDVRYAWIPQTFQAEPAEEFDPVFMGELFGLGQTLMSSGTLWHDAPPNFTAPGTTAVERGDEPMPVLTE
ncbi:MAG: patatin-like phospholipase family protein, partial [Pseudomonadota bacterium]